MATTIDALPTEILAHILGYLSGNLRTLARANQTCIMWYNITRELVPWELPVEVRVLEPHPEYRYQEFTLVDSVPCSPTASGPENVRTGLYLSSPPEVHGVFCVTQRQLYRDIHMDGVGLDEMLDYAIFRGQDVDRPTINVTKIEFTVSDECSFDTLRVIDDTFSWVSHYAFVITPEGLCSLDRFVHVKAMIRRRNEEELDDEDEEHDDSSIRPLSPSNATSSQMSTGSGGDDQSDSETWLSEENYTCEIPDVRRLELCLQSQQESPPLQGNQQDPGNFEWTLEDYGRLGRLLRGFVSLRHLDCNSIGTLGDGCLRRLRHLDKLRHLSLGHYRPGRDRISYTLPIRSLDVTGGGYESFDSLPWSIPASITPTALASLLLRCTRLKSLSLEMRQFEGMLEQLQNPNVSDAALDRVWSGLKEIRVIVQMTCVVHEAINTVSRALRRILSEPYRHLSRLQVHLCVQGIGSASTRTRIVQMKTSNAGREKGSSTLLPTPTPTPATAPATAPAQVTISPSHNDPMDLFAWTVEKFQQMIPKWTTLVRGAPVRGASVRGATSSTTSTTTSATSTTTSNHNLKSVQVHVTVVRKQQRQESASKRVRCFHVPLQ